MNVKNAVVWVVSTGQSPSLCELVENLGRFEHLRLVELHDLEAVLEEVHRSFPNFVVWQDCQELRIGDLFDKGEADLLRFSRFVVVGKGAHMVLPAATNTHEDQYFQAESDVEILKEYCSELIWEKPNKIVKLSDLHPYRMMYQISQTKWTGTFSVENEKSRFDLFFKDGHFVFASTDQDERQFGEYLLRQGLLTKDQFEKASEVMEQSGQRLGTVLVEQNIVPQDHLNALLQSQVKYIFFHFFSMDDADCTVQEDGFMIEQLALVDFEVPSLLLEFYQIHHDLSTKDALSRLKKSNIHLSVKPEQLIHEFRLSDQESKLLAHLHDNQNSAGTRFSRSLTADCMAMLLLFEELGVLSFTDFNQESQKAKDEREMVVESLFALKRNGADDAAVPAGVIKDPLRAIKGSWLGILGLMVCMVIYFNARLVTHESRNARVRAKIEAFQVGPEVQQSKPQTMAADRVAPSPPKQEPLADTATAAATAESAEAPKSTPSIPKVPAPKPKLVMVDVVKAPPPVATPVAHSKPKALPKKPAVRPKRVVALATPKKTAPKPVLNVFEDSLKKADEAMKSRKPEIALAFLGRARRIRENSGRMHRLTGEAHLELGDTKKAQQAFEEWLLVNPGDPEAHLAMGTVLLMSGNMKRAKRHLETFLSNAHRSSQSGQRVREVRLIVDKME